MHPLRLSSLLKHAVDCQGVGSHMYFSYSLDLTHRSQQQALRAAQYAAASNAKAVWALTEAELVWNGHLAKPLLGEAMGLGKQRWDSWNVGHI